MAGSRCAREWQAEASRDGRLSGKDSRAALRHREQCAECSAEQRALEALQQEFASLTQLPRDPLAVHRGRQRLMATLNESLLAAPSRRWPPWAAVLAPLALGAIGCVLLLRHVRTAAPLAIPRAAIEVHASPGARWRIASQLELDRVELDDGVATFEVHPHLGRRVVVVLPDGELEDLGTTFEVSVHDGHTESIAVSHGRVLVHLGGRPEFSVQVGERWLRPEPLAPAPAPVIAVSPPPATPALPVAPRAARFVSPRVSGPAPLDGRAATASAEPVPMAAVSLPSPESLERASRRAEDAAYLGVLSSLRQQRYPEARARAKAYLLEFPNGFRRVEVLNIAVSREGATGVP